MAADAAMVDLAALRVGDRIGDGGEGQVHLVDWPADPGPWVLKRYTAELPAERWAHIRSLVALRPHIELGSEMLAWPQVVVRDRGRDVGVLLPRAPAAFWHAFTLRSGAEMVRLVEAQFLFFDDRKVKGLGLTPAVLATRMELLGTVVAAIEFLHNHGLVYGDLSARNILYSMDEGAGAFLLDCDGIVPEGTAYVVDSPDWGLPDAPGVAATSSDVYKLGLFALRTFVKQPRAVALTPDSGVPAPLVGVLRRCLDPDPATRPDVGEVATAIAPLAIPPVPDERGRRPAWDLADDGTVVAGRLVAGP